MTPAEAVKVANSARLKKIDEEVAALLKERAAIIDGRRMCITVDQVETFFPNPLHRAIFYMQAAAAQ